MTSTKLGDIRLRGVINIDQYIIDKRLLTILGEIHLRNIDGIKGDITFPDYAERYAWNVIYLETPGVEPLQKYTGSYNINAISERAEMNYGLKEKIVGVDSRISYFYNNYLYGDLDDSTSLREFLTQAYEPLRYNQRWERRLKPVNYSEDNYKYLLSMVEDIRNKISQFVQIFLQPIKQYLYQNRDMTLGEFRRTKHSMVYDPQTDLNYSYVYVLRDIWAKIADFGAMLEIFKKSNSGKKLLLLFGENHAKSFYQSFIKQNIFSSRLYGNLDLQSVSLRDSYV